MTNRIVLGASVAWGALATAAAADVTPQQVWDNWVQTLTANNSEYTTASETMDGKALTITDLKITQAHDSGSAVFTIPQIVLTGNADGTVSVATSPEYDGQVTFTEEGKTTDMDLYIRQVGADMLISGSPEHLSTAYTSDAVSVGLDELKLDGKAIQDAVVDLTMNGLKGETIEQEGARDSAYSMQNMTLDVSMVDPESKDSVKVDALFNGIELATELRGDEAAMGDFHAMAMAGATAKFNMSSADSRMNVTGQSENNPFAVALTAGASSVTSDVSKDGLAYSNSNQNLHATIETAAFPAPIELDMAEQSSNLTAPILPGEAPAPVAAGVALRDFTMSDQLWDIFDPAKVLPRIPATIALGLEGDAILKAPLFDPSKADEIAQMFETGNPPATLDNLRLTELQITAAGATITGKGQMKFDNTDLQTFNGFPRPEGEVSLRAVGLNSLLDNLGKMGILPPEQLMGPRMMLSMFTVVESEDTLTSKIEIKGGGQILANGQRIR
ncbi:hypothetical protein [Donghicola mangrovi]|uniref:DUF2125 domain-containing protein n=1 Tax=Donghicola mangrovi TaxID=2729614 RepID=A0A850PZX2_9RHOB|nr:hypothetical protein [Donghicola mangrovi]NVO22294.1 DUF2125 domain-containing protein [Donghicola mangrovi]